MKKLSQLIEEAKQELEKHLGLNIRNEVNPVFGRYGIAMEPNERLRTIHKFLAQQMELAAKGMKEATFLVSCPYRGHAATILWIKARQQVIKQAKDFLSS